MFARGNRRQEIYLDDVDRATYRSMLGRVVERCGWRLLAFCLMDNHVHLLVRTPVPNLGDGMRRLHGDYALLFNDRHGFRGHLFQDRYGSKRVMTDEYLWSLVPYLAHNPVKAKLCRSPEQWPWGSHAVMTGDAAPAAWLDAQGLLGLLDDGRERYDGPVAGRGVPDPLPAPLDEDDLWAAARRPPARAR